MLRKRTHSVVCGLHAVLGLLLLLPVGLWAGDPKPLKGSFDDYPLPPAPDYALDENWSALPHRRDAPDRLPRAWRADTLPQRPVAVFFVHPTTHLKPRYGWVAPIGASRPHRLAERYPNRQFASVFTGLADVYIPRYRQAYIWSFIDSLSPNSRRALDTAYADIRRAFQHFLQRIGNRPFILAGHSQGSWHVLWLLRREVENTPLQARLVAAWAIGLPNWVTQPQNLPVCCSPTQTGCWLTFNTFYAPLDTTIPTYPHLRQRQPVNPLSWECSTAPVPASRNPGSYNLLFLPLKPIYGAQVSRGVVLTDPKRRLGVISFRRGDLHIMDYNLFWGSIRSNARTRILAYLQQTP